jgi:putative transposase
MKTIEFKIRPNKATIQRIETWLTDLRKVWNIGLELLEENQQWYWREKSGIIYEDDCYPVPWEWRKNEDGAFGLCCSIAAPSHRRYGKADQLYPSPDKDYRLCCTIKKSPSNQPPEYVIKGKNPWKSLGSYFAFKNHPDKPWLTEIPCVFIRGTLHSLAKAWEEYRKGTRERPRYKSAKNPIKTLSCFDCASAIAIKGNQVKLPKLGYFTSKTLDERWNPDTKICTAKLCKRPSGWYVQLTGAVSSKPVKPSTKACGLDVGLQYIISDDAGNVVEPPKYLRKSEEKLKRLQRKASRQYRMNKRSKNWEKTQKLIARQHEKVADQRRLFNHKISTYRVRTYAAIAVEDIKLTNLMKRAKPIETEEGSGVWAHNRASQKSGLSKSFADAGLGQLLTMIEAKAKVTGRLFERVAPHHTSQDCPKCQYRQKKSLSQRTHKCGQCGYTAPRDVAAAINILGKASFAEIYPRSVRGSQASGSSDGRDEGRTVLKLTPGVSLALVIVESVDKAITLDEAGTVLEPTSGSLPDNFTQLSLFDVQSAPKKGSRKKKLKRKRDKVFAGEQLQLLPESGRNWNQ